MSMAPVTWGPDGHMEQELSQDLKDILAARDLLNSIQCDPPMDVVWNKAASLFSRRFLSSMSLFRCPILPWQWNGRKGMKWNQEWNELMVFSQFGERCCEKWNEDAFRTFFLSFCSFAHFPLLSLHHDSWHRTIPVLKVAKSPDERKVPSNSSQTETGASFGCNITVTEAKQRSRTVLEQCCRKRNQSWLVLFRTLHSTEQNRTHLPQNILSMKGKPHYLPVISFLPSFRTWFWKRGEVLELAERESILRESGCIKVWIAFLDKWCHPYPVIPPSNCSPLFFLEFCSVLCDTFRPFSPRSLAFTPLNTEQFCKYRYWYHRIFQENGSLLSSWSSRTFSRNSKRIATPNVLSEKREMRGGPPFDL